MIDFSSGPQVYCIGIKGTGMCALAEYCRHAGANVEGSDVQEVFYTDEILKSLEIPVHTPFKSGNLPSHIDYLFYSAAYDADNNPELAEASRRGIPGMSYPQALGMISRGQPTGAVAGVHGKTTTTALAGSMAQAAGLPVGVIVGSGVSNFDGRSCLFLGDKGLIAETCEYRRHFLNISPRWLIVTSIEPDHLDYFRDYGDIFDAFTEYALKLPENGTLIYCADDAGASELAGKMRILRADLRLIPYGFSADGEYGIQNYRVEGERLVAELAGFSKPLRLRIPGRHSVLNAAAAAALVTVMGADLGLSLDRQKLLSGCEEFRGSRRRSEIVGEAGGILFMDDYAHHPTAIRTTLRGLREFYPHRRLVVDFMSHTYSRTAALFDGFAAAFGDADELVLHDIYASAREDSGGVSGEQLYRKTAENHPSVRYYPEPADSLEELDSLLSPGDLFISMGAGNNWLVSHELYKRRKGRSA
ncbi:UDP-N-acetylmuramate--L-alanine ligase [Marispirochaeta aestuarii]|uniref:UDP-N-acetylmuramate--L-alanine ligase n=2 Tax=Marispirochaeta aestuarii TaxID=1963862 RepID=A0A1Y1RWA1_9SPIO|nr:UDP-N-acetylmuramate--L-alanine ligase [Marispirochaeta aestuarii]